MNLNVRKRTFWHVRPTKTQISLRIRTVWLVSLLVARWQYTKSYPMFILNFKILGEVALEQSLTKYFIGEKEKW